MGVILALDEVDRQLGAGAATPNHVLTVSPVLPCMATEPEQVPRGIEPIPGRSRKFTAGEPGLNSYYTGLVAGVAQAGCLAGRGAGRPGP